MALSYEHFAEWCEREKSMTPQYKGSFTRLERIILFCKIAIGWGRETMVHKLKISERQVSNTYRKLREFGYGDVNNYNKKDGKDGKEHKFRESSNTDTKDKEEEGTLA